MATKRKHNFRTDRDVKLLKPQAERYECWDSLTPGFGVRVSPEGRKSFFWLYRYEGRPRRITFGRYPALSLTNARARQAKAQELLEEEGKDPGALLVKTRSADREAPTVNDLADEFLEKWAKPRKRSWREDERQLNADVLPLIGHKKIASVTRRDVIQILDAIVERGSPIAANRTFAVVRKMFRFGITRDLVPHNPCEALQAPSKERQRDRCLTADEIKTFWLALDDDGMKIVPSIRLILKIMLLTAQRPGEVISVEWSHLDLSSGWWTIPESRAKNKLPHRVPLSTPACKLFKTIEKASDDDEYLFPSYGQCGHICTDAVNRAVRINRTAFGIPSFVPHDLRRTAASHMASMGTPRLTVGKILNHVETSITAVYDRYSYDQEKRKALNAWSRKLESIISGKRAKVIELKTG
ncbi:MAG: tyrosine-type recombinase/integrase [Proteobacteria bacterium]|nr:tyrosine-type recombinase/integrase [Pseudomonadota bacterium]